MAPPGLGSRVQPVANVEGDPGNAARTLESMVGSSPPDDSRERIEAAASGFPALTQPVVQQWVFALYGAVMLQVQSFEAQLAALDLVVTARPTTHTSPKGLERRLQKRLVKIRHLIDKATAEEAETRTGGPDRRRVDGRDRLSHRLAQPPCASLLAPAPRRRGGQEDRSVPGHRG
jgi:hypothetical protein